uniref:Uncharacterized protein n=1 Tax=Octopus bimaculoides TaxID=37653 RepID=A0A0L8IFX7_OCTBM
MTNYFIYLFVFYLYEFFFPLPVKWFIQRVKHMRICFKKCTPINFVNFLLF